MASHQSRRDVEITGTAPFRSKGDAIVCSIVPDRTARNAASHAFSGYEPRAAGRLSREIEHACLSPSRTAAFLHSQDYLAFIQLAPSYSCTLMSPCPKRLSADVMPLVMLPTDVALTNAVYRPRCWSSFGTVLDEGSERVLRATDVSSFHIDRSSRTECHFIISDHLHDDFQV